MGYLRPPSNEPGYTDGSDGLETVQYEMSAALTVLISDRVVSDKTGNLSCVGFNYQGSVCVGLECVEDNCTGSLAGYSKL
jgi:hypothetical protein